ncbi:MAG: LPD38 domain-containing protein, partial [Desulfovermiculus sp.]
DGVKIIDEEYGDDWYVVFSPTQIKSVFNRGTWDRNDPRISYSRKSDKSQDNLRNALLKAQQEVKGKKDKANDPPQDLDAENQDDFQFFTDDQRSQAQDELLSGVNGKGSKRLQNPGTYLESAISKIGKPDEKTSDKIKRWADNWRERWNQGMFDRFASLKSLDVEAGVTDPQEKSYIAARFTTSLADQLSAIVHYGPPIWKDGAMGVDTKKGGFLDILKQVKGEEKDFFYWLIGQRANKLMQEGRENLFTQEEIDALRSLSKGREARFLKAKRDYVVFKKNVLDFAEQAGLVNPESRKLWEHDEYIPFYRIAEAQEATKGPRSKKGIEGQTSGIKTLKGGEQNIGDPMANILQNFTHLVDASLKNNAMDLAITNAEKIGAATKAQYKWEALKLKGGTLAKALDNVIGEDVFTPLYDRLSSSERNALQTVFRMVKPSDKDVVSVTRNGKPEFYHIHDSLLLRSLTNVNAQSWNNSAMKVSRGMKRMLTIGVTSSPDFMLRNLARDTIHAWAVSESGFRPVVGSIAGAAKTLRQDEDTIQMLAAGAAFHGGYAIGHDPEASAREVNRILNKHGVDRKSILDTPKKLVGFTKWGWDRWQDLGIAIENSTRTRIYDKERKAGSTHLEAAFAAKDIMDYSMRGDWPMIQFMCEVVPFLGARIQGLHRLGRGAKENPWSFARKGMMISLAATALAITNWDDERYKELEEWDKDNYFHFWVGDRHFRLPKPFEVGALFGTIPERIVEQVMQGPDGKQALDRLWFMIRQTFAFDYPQVMKPWMEQWANKDTFTGRDIVGIGLERLMPEAQSYPWTSETAKELGEATDMSPKRIEHFVRSTFGTLGMYALSASDVVVRHSMDYPYPPSRRLDDMPIIKSFYRQGPSRHTKYVTEMYDTIKEVDQLMATVREYRRRQDLDAAEGIFAKMKNEWGVKDEADFRQLLATKEAWAKEVRPFFRDINGAIRNIHRNKDLTPEQKRDRIDKLLRRKNNVAKRAYKAVRSAEEKAQAGSQD